MATYVFDEEEREKLRLALERYRRLGEIRSDLDPAAAWKEIVQLSYETRSNLWAEAMPCWPDMISLVSLVTRLDEQGFKIAPGDGRV